MEAQSQENHIPQCPALRPSDYSDDIEQITLEDEQVQEENISYKFRLSSTSTEEWDLNVHIMKSVEAANIPFNILLTILKKWFENVYINELLNRRNFYLFLLNIISFFFFFVKFIIDLMRKKQANLYFPDKKYKDPPYLTKEQIKDFKSQFELFSHQLNVQKLKEAMLNQNYQNNCKPVYEFINKISQEKQYVNYDDYLNKMTLQLQKVSQGELIVNMIDEQSKGEISKESLKQILEETLGREVLAQEMNDITKKLFDTTSEKISNEHLKKFINQMSKLK